MTSQNRILHKTQKKEFSNMVYTLISKENQKTLVFRTLLFCLLRSSMSGMKDFKEELKNYEVLKVEMEKKEVV